MAKTNTIYCSPELVQKVCLLLHSRGIEATIKQVDDWAFKMAQKQWSLNSFKRRCNQWLEAVIEERPIATALIHLHFGDQP